MKRAWSCPSRKFINWNFLRKKGKIEKKKFAAAAFAHFQIPLVRQSALEQTLSPVFIFLSC